MVLMKRTDGNDRISIKQRLEALRKAPLKVSQSVIFQCKRPADALRWDQIIWMAVVGLAFWVLVQNNSNAQNLMATIITTVQTTLEQMLTATY